MNLAKIRSLLCEIVSIYCIQYANAILSGVCFMVLFVRAFGWKIGCIQGGYAKGSGKYEYEAESKSKSTSKSGAAVVPVCLPLCCAMPCTIM